MQHDYRDEAAQAKELDALIREKRIAEAEATRLERIQELVKKGDNDAKA